MLQISAKLVLWRTSGEYSQTEESIKHPVYINFWILFQHDCEITKELFVNKIMYSEGEIRYLQDLDWVNIVKAIRELKAMSRVILTQQQLQLLSFEREGILPVNKEFKTEEPDSIYNKVPFEYANNTKITDYFANVNKFIDGFGNSELTEDDK